MKILIFSDSHIRASTPRCRKDNFPTALWEKFRQITQIILDRGINAVLMGGDLFDTPNPSISIVNSYLQLFTYWKIPIYSIVGSHDKFGYNNDTLYRTGLGTLIASGAVQLLNETQRIGNNTQIAGVSHSYDLDEHPETDYYRKKLNPDEYLIEVCHGMLLDVPWKFSKHTNVKEIRTEADLCVGGHYHPGFSAIQVENTTVVNVGSLGRVENIHRKFPPGVIVVDTDIVGKEFWEFIPLNVSEDVFRTKEIKVEKAYENINTFIQLLKDRSNNFECGNIKELIVTVGKKEKYSKEIIEKALKYIE